MGIDFRDTSGFVTDPANCTYTFTSGDGDLYPKTRGGVGPFGWDTTKGGGDSHRSGNSRDRDSGIDSRLAGLEFGCGATPCYFRIDLPAPGSYKLFFAFGDATGGANAVDSKIYDNSTFLTEIGPISNSAGQFVDASGTNRTSAADWVTNGAPTFITQTFASSIFYITIENGGTGPLTHIFISPASNPFVPPAYNNLRTTIR